MDAGAGASPDAALGDAAADAAPGTPDAMADASEPATSVCGCQVPPATPSGMFEGGITGRGVLIQYDISTRTCGLRYSLTDPRYTSIMDPDARCALAWTRAGDGSLRATTEFQGDPLVATPYGPAIPLTRQTADGCRIDVTVPDAQKSKVLHVEIQDCTCTYSYRSYYPAPTNPL